MYPRRIKTQNLEEALGPEGPTSGQRSLSHQCTPTYSVDHMPSLDVDYESLDANDPQLKVGWFPSLPFMGIGPRDPNDPCYKALAKLRIVTSQHGIEHVTLHDFCLALGVFASVADRQAKRAIRRKRLSYFSSANERRMESQKQSGQAQLLQIPERTIPRETERQNRSPHRRSVSSIPSQVGEDSDKERQRRWSLPEQFDRVNDGLIFEMFTVGSTAITQSPVWNPRDLDSFLNSPPKIRPEHIQLMYHMLRHAESIYGLPLNVPSAPRVSLTRMTDRGIVCARTGISHSDIVHSVFQTEPFLPAHYVAVDTQVRAIVVCIRGTANFVDLLTDVAATTDPLRIRSERSGCDDIIVEGYGHAGVVRSARNVFNRIRDVTLKAIHENPGFELFITGHSLGAATAAILALIMRDDPEFPRATAVCIAPPPCMTLELAEETAANTITIVNGPDIVPRLSVAVLLPFFSTAQFVSSLNASQKALLSVGMKRSVIDWRALDRHNESRIREMKKHHEGKRLYIPGKVFQLVRRKEQKLRDKLHWRPFRRRSVQVVPVSRVCFHQMPERERGMFLAHAPFNYKVSLLLALKHMGSGPLRKMSAGSILGNIFSLPVVAKLQRRNGCESLDGLLEKLTQDGSESPVPR
ncbi:Sn1-specific diacylglycerol lipase beta [Gracilariopsis chorda]|uniref:sn-1-specific diacylglycerol lipase n=1 Tax=Gracilariopsis chorda TaxID=448386 RepID=A0A2V3IWB8_9FLOR|nr:Sn1-specific diacylglycerol lipase beta [Gracilariopsis chorda]|eukprot:PXF46385.1 Sn1-specific diacylglycerol lipase beta [Gracilariopsis chorda]